MSKIKQDEIPMTLTEENVLKVAVEQGVIETEFSWKLVREHDGKVCRSKDVIWIEWDENGHFKTKHDEPAVGRSLIMSPFNQFFTWQTTVITEILAAEVDLSYIKFKTKNSTYELFKLQ